MTTSSSERSRILDCKRDLYRALCRLAASEAGDLTERLASLYRSDAVWARGASAQRNARGGCDRRGRLASAP